MSGNNNYTTGNLLDIWYHQNSYKLISIYLSRQANTSIPQKNSFTGKLEKEEGATMPFIIKKQQKTILNVSLEASVVTKWYKRWNIEK